MKQEKEYQVQSESKNSLLSLVHKSESSGRLSREAEKEPIPDRQKIANNLRKKLKKEGIEEATKSEAKETRLEEKWKNGLIKNKKIVEKMDFIDTAEGKELKKRLFERTGKRWDRYFHRYQESLEDCGKISSVSICGDCETRFSLTPRESCSKRICPLCARRATKKWFWDYAPRILHYAKTHREEIPVHITLTVKSKEAEELGLEIVQLQENFLKLRRRVFWKEAFSGAISSIECTWNEKTGRPHPHIHILAFRKNWVSQSSLSQEWEDVSGSKVVWISRAYSKDNLESDFLNKWESLKGDKGLMDAIIEASKYVVKSEDLSKLDGEKICEFIGAVRGRNLKDILGQLRGIKVVNDEERARLIEVFREKFFKKNGRYPDEAELEEFLITLISIEEELELIEQIKILMDVEEDKDSEQCWACGSVHKYIVMVEFDHKTNKMNWIDTT